MLTSSSFLRNSCMSVRRSADTVCARCNACNTSSIMRPSCPATLRIMANLRSLELPRSPEASPDAAGASSPSSPLAAEMMLLRCSSSDGMDVRSVTEDMAANDDAMCPGLPASAFASGTDCGVDTCTQGTPNR